LEGKVDLSNWKMDIIVSSDGTTKFRHKLVDGLMIESVVIPLRDGKICLCLSSQAGCSLRCVFCVTGKEGLFRDLTHDEIILQLEAMWDHIKPKTPTSIVFMGMGEPLLNYDNVIKAIRTINDRKRYNFAEHKITVSTAGVADRIVDFGNDCNAKLAISLNSADDKRRSDLMPINRKHDIEAIISECKKFPVSRRRLLMFEYIMFKGVNDSTKDADALAELLKDIPSLVNLIPFNEHPYSDLCRSDPDVVLMFKKRLMSKGIKTFIRESRGQDIGAACGMLSP